VHPSDLLAVSVRCLLAFSFFFFFFVLVFFFFRDMRTSMEDEARSAPPEIRRDFLNREPITGPRPSTTGFPRAARRDARCNATVMPDVPRTSTGERIPLGPGQENTAVPGPRRTFGL